MRVGDDKIEEIRRSSDIVDVIAGFVQLKKRGKNYLGLCPFHQEKTPSFNVSPEKQMFHCFGCGVGGNVFTFIMEHEKVSFIEAVRTLSDRAGIPLPERGGDQGLAGENEGLYKACKTAGLRFYDNLVNSTEGQLGLEYLKHRGFSDATIRKFGLGYSRNAWNDIVEYAAGLKHDLAEYEKAGLIIKRDDGSSLYDRFRGRVMFPIFSPSGRPIGFGARKIREDDTVQGKYMNSPETPIYSKSRNLYGLSHSKEAIRERGFAILVEGYADLISVFQAGIENIVASSGTALTVEQIQLISRYAKTIVLVYDADSAGSKATMRGVDLVIENGLDVKVAALPPGDDPDSFVRKKGGGEFTALIGQAVSFLEFKAESFVAEGLLKTPEGKTQAVRSLVEIIAKVRDEIKRNFYIKSIAEKYDIYESVLFRELEAVLRREHAPRTFLRPRGSADAPLRRGDDSPSPPVPPSPATLSAIERDLLKIMLEAGPDMVKFVFRHLTIDVFTHPLARQVAEILQRETGENRPWNVSLVVDRIEDPALKHFIADVTFTKYEISKEWQGVEEPDRWVVAEKSVLRALLRDIDRRIGENFAQLKSAQLRGESVGPFQAEHLRLEGEKKRVESTSLLDTKGE